MKILISGGHLTPALAFIDYLQTSQKHIEIIFVGRTFSRESDKQLSREQQEVETRKIPFYPLTAAKVSSRFPLAIITQIPRFATSLADAVKIISTHKPDLFVSFGGYLAVPVALSCWLQRVPIITHEQTRSVGFSNQLIGKLAKKVAVSYAESKHFFPEHKVAVTGNLIRKQLLQKHPLKPEWYTTEANLPMLYVTGGSQGSEVINSTVSQLGARLLRDWIVIHQCGGASDTRNYAQELEQKKQQYSKAQQARYYIREWVTETELSWIYRHATAAISRAGANTTQELSFSKLPSVLIPLPFSHHQEQQKNAEALAATGGAILIAQKHLTPDSLLAALETLRTKNQACRRKLATLQITEHADTLLFELVTEVLPAAREKKAS